ncbi:hypothetical protein [Labedaea rhizosphaerae]|uniref:Uncharacterized protein n=1 Tax=Labedaea rhizosphaerae TaxID=598644 RepID=A0A4V3CXF8_LABRH|nr:hypothetical protein [Labedaea rhizosphaerae]TDP90008.1 hypothetical protein EV186_111134 [Labedaea rhizosphaerae]
MEEKKLYSTRVDEQKLVTWDGDQYGVIMSELSHSEQGGEPVYYLIKTFGRGTAKVPVRDVKFIADDDFEQKRRAEEFRDNNKPKKPPAKKAAKPRPVAPEGIDLAKYLAGIEVGKHDTALSYITAVVVRARAESGAKFSAENVGILFDQYVAWANGNDKPIAGIDPTNLLARIEGELYHIEGDTMHKHSPFGSAEKEADALDSGFLKASSVAKAVEAQYVGRYAYHTTSFTNLYLIARNGLRRDFGGTPGGSCYLAENAAQRDNSIQHSKDVIAAGLTRQVMNTYGNQRENRADEVVDDDALARRRNRRAPQADLDERGVLLRFKIKATHLWVADPQDGRAVLLKNSDVPAAELECLTEDGWVGLGQLSALGEALGYGQQPDGGEEFQVFLRQSERVLWRLDNVPTDNDILEGRAFIKRGMALGGKFATSEAAQAQLQVIINQLTDRLSRLPDPDRATNEKD